MGGCCRGWLVKKTLVGRVRANCEAPEDVLEFLFWMRSRFRDTQKAMHEIGAPERAVAEDRARSVLQAFEAFDGADGNGLLGLREFEESRSVPRVRGSAALLTLLCARKG